MIIIKYEDVTTPEELLKFMDQIEYGFVTPDHQRIIGNGKDFDKNILSWTLSSPEKLLETKLGHCFDQVEIERDWFTKHNYIFKTYFLIFSLPYENGGPTHTFLVYEKNNKFYHFEHADALNKGLHEFNNLEELLNDAYQKQLNYASSFLNEEELKTLSIYEYQNPPYDIDFVSYINYLVTNGHKIK